MTKTKDEQRKAELIQKCLNNNNHDNKKTIHEKLNELRKKSKGQDKVLINMLLSE